MIMYSDFVKDGAFMQRWRSIVKSCEKWRKVEKSGFFWKAQDPTDPAPTPTCHLAPIHASSLWELGSYAYS